MSGSTIPAPSHRRKHAHWLELVAPHENALRTLPRACDRILRALAQLADDEGYVSITRHQGAARAGINPRTWQRGIRGLEAAKILQVHSGRGRTTSVYRFTRCRSVPSSGRLLLLPRDGVHTASETTCEPSPVALGDGTHAVSHESTQHTPGPFDKYLTTTDAQGTQRASHVHDYVRCTEHAPRLKPSSVDKSLKTGPGEQKTGGKDSGEGGRSADAAQRTVAPDGEDTIQVRIGLLMSVGMFRPLAQKLAPRASARWIQYAIAYFRGQERDGLLQTNVGNMIRCTINGNWVIPGAPGR